MGPGFSAGGRAGLADLPASAAYGSALGMLRQLGSGVLAPCTGAVFRHEDG